MKKQTALEWYWEKIKSHFEHDGDLLETATFTFAIAKEKEREQIVEAFDEGQEYEYQYHVNGTPKFDSETYFIETYKGGEQ
jgi:hypothetical protein